MLDADLTSPPRAQRKSARRLNAEALAAANKDLFKLLATLRAASATSLLALHFSQPPRYASERSTYRRLARLVDAGLLFKQPLPDSRTLYGLGSTALALVPELGARVTDAYRKPVPDAEAGYCWLRPAMWAAMKRLGFTVGRGQPELVAVRRALIDSQAMKTTKGAERVLAALRADPALAPVFRSRCPRCGWLGPIGVAHRGCAQCRSPVEPQLSERKFACATCGFVGDGDVVDGDQRHSSRCRGAVRETDHLGFDVAWRGSGAKREVVILFVDDPGVALDAQLRALPLRIVGQPRLDIVLRTTDAVSVFDRRRRAWTAQGDRHRALLRAFSEAGAANIFPFSMTANVIDVAPEIQLRLAPPRRRKERSHA